MSDLSFEAPWRLLLLLAVITVAVLYVLLQGRRGTYAVRFADLDLLASVAPRGPGWRRHVSAALLVGALALMTAAFARPAASVEVPRETATIIVTLDTSLSMQATDVPPTRFAAAQDAAARFVEGLPDTFDVGLVSFSGDAVVRVTPTQDHAAVVRAVRALELGEGTAIGDAVAASLTAADRPVGEDGEVPPARIVLLSDGTNTAGRTVESAATAAAAAGVPVSTIAYGTPEGTVTVGGETVPVPADTAVLRELAEATRGQAYEAASGDELSAAYEDIGEQIGTTVEKREISAGVTGVALLLALAAAAASLAWSPRLP